MFYRLKERYALRGWEKLPWAVADRLNGRAYFVTKEDMEALMLCTGTIDTDLPLISDAVRERISRLEKHGIVEPCPAGSSLRPGQEYRRFPARYIHTAHWSITGRCNYRCRHCYMSAPDAKLGELSHEQIMKMVGELAACGVMNVSLTGGEPLVRKDFLEIVDALLEKEIRIIQIFSNGALVKEQLLKELDARGVRPEFNMSYDGLGWHDWLRGVPGAEEAVDRAFRLCRDMGFPTASEMCIHQGNKHLLRASLQHLREVGCGSVKTVPVSDVGEWQKNGAGQSVTMDELFQIYLDYLPAYYEDGMPIGLMLGGFFSADPREPDLYSIPLYHPSSDPARCCVCGHARMVMYISPEGRALPCMSLSGMEIQNEFPLIPELGLARCITDSRYMDLIDTRADKVLDSNPECADCAWRTWCLGGCRASGLEDSGQLDLLRRDPAACALFRDGWIGRIMERMRQIRPEASCPAAKDPRLMRLIRQMDGETPNGFGNKADQSMKSL